MVKWYYDDEEEKKKDELLQTPAIKSVQAVQDNWQPIQTASGKKMPQVSSDIFGQDDEDEGNYLLSEEKAQLDEEKRQQEAAEAAEAAAHAAAAAAAEAQQRAAAAEEASVVAEEEPEDNHAAIDRGLDAGKSWEDISAETGISLDDVRNYSQSTRPKYGIDVSQYQPKYAERDKKDEGLWGLIKGLGAGIQQGIGAVGDVAVQGGSLLGYAKDRLTGVSEEEAAKRLYENGENLRSMIHNMRDINGQQIVGTRDVDDAAARIARGEGNAQDWVAVGGKGLQVGLDATMFANPTRNVMRVPMPAVEGVNFVRKAANHPVVRGAARDAAFYGGMQGIATGAQSYGETGDIGQAIGRGAQDAILSAVTQGALDLGGYGAGRAFAKVHDRLTPIRENLLENKHGAKIGDDVVVPYENSAVPPREAASPDTNVSFQQRAEAHGYVTPEANGGELRPVKSVNRPLIAENQMPLLLEKNPVHSADGVVEPRTLDDAAPTQELQQNPETPTQPVQAENPPAEAAQPVADGVNTPNKENPTEAPVSRADEVRQLQEAKAGATQAEEAALNAKLQQIDPDTPSVEGSSLPDNMDSVPVETPKSSGADVNAPLTMKDLAERTVAGSAKPDDFNAGLARAVGLTHDAGSPIADILSEAKVSQKIKDNFATKYAELEDLITKQNEIQRKHRAMVRKDNLAEGSPLSQEWSAYERRKGELQRDLSNIIRFIDSKQSAGHKLAYVLENIVSGKNANQLLSVPGISRNALQDALGTVEAFVKNPVRAVKSMPNGGNPFGSAAKSAMNSWKATPLSVSEAYKYGVGNLYETVMTPVTGVANMRKQPIREALAEANLRAAGKNPTRAEVVNYARMMGADEEALVNVLVGSSNAMTNRIQANKAMAAYEQLRQTGSEAYRSQLHQLVERQNTLAQKLVSGFEKHGTPRQRTVAALAEAILPYARVATNATINAAYRLVPHKTVIDQLLASGRSSTHNKLATFRNTVANYGLLGTVLALVNAGAIVYNNGDEVDKPRGISIRLIGDTYIPIRATNMETEIAAVLTAYNIATGKSRPDEAINMMSDSLPYISSTDNALTAGKSLLAGEGEGGDNMYHAKSFAVNQGKSLIPLSNNGIQPFVASTRWQSLNAKSSYDKDMGKWFTNAVRQAYDPWFRETLPDSRDAAGRVRTVDNQGIFIHKKINDAQTAEFNPTIERLVNYSKENKLGKDVGEMFNTFDNDKNNNFRSVQNAITFLDTQGGKPDNAKKLEKNGKLADLSRQIRDGFFGGSGAELLTLGGNTLKSDASVPTKNGTKNSQLPISMQSIRNAIAQTDLPAEQRDTLYKISGQSTELYNALKSKQISYEQYNTAKTELHMQEQAILSGSANYQKLNNFMRELDDSGFFSENGLGSTKSGQTYLWNALNAMLGAKGSTPAAQYQSDENYTPYGRGGWIPYGRRGGRFGNGGKSGFGASDKTGNRGNAGIKWEPVSARKMATVQGPEFIPFKVKVNLANEIRKNKTQRYTDMSF